MPTRTENFEKLIVPKANALLKNKGFEVIKYFEGVIGDKRSAEIKVLFEESAKNQKSLNKDDFSDIATMGRT